MSASLDNILAQAMQQLDAVKELNELDQVRVQYLGKKGAFTLLMKELGTLDPEQRRSAGQLINDAKDQFQSKFDQLKQVLTEAELSARLASEQIDVTLPGRGQAVAGLHPVTTTLRRINQIFSSVGFFGGRGARN